MERHRKAKQEGKTLEKERAQCERGKSKKGEETKRERLCDMKRAREKENGGQKTDWDSYGTKKEKSQMTFCIGGLRVSKHTNSNIAAIFGSIKHSKTSHMASETDQ